METIRLAAIAHMGVGGLEALVGFQYIMHYPNSNPAPKVYFYHTDLCGSRAQSQACLSYAEMEQCGQSKRTLKVTGHSHQLDVNADLMHTAAGLDEFTLYPSPYLVFTNRGYTKHYYAGSERLAARIGGGFGKPILAEHHQASQQAKRLFEQCQKQTEKRVLEAIPPHTIRRGRLPENIYMAMMREFDAPMHLMANAVTKEHDLINAAQNIVSDNTEPEVYFYHSDHLGSASWITDATGTPVQHLQYLPYGEPFVNQRVSGYNERFTFTGKERDEETGYSYFGARYMDHELMTMWLSVDPLADKYPNISPYNYCMWNPMKLVDPDGRDVDPASVTQEIRNLINPSHECYNAEFASVYQELDADKSTIYRFEQWNEFRTNAEGKAISGSVSLSSDQTITIGFTWGLETSEVDMGIAPERALFEETYHAKQFSEGKFGFAKFYGLSGWRWIGYDLSDEEDAHDWAKRVSGTTIGYNLDAYGLGTKSISAEDGWRSHSPDSRTGQIPSYDSNGLHSSDVYYFKRPQK